MFSDTPVINVAVNAKGETFFFLWKFLRLLLGKAQDLQSFSKEQNKEQLLKIPVHIFGLKEAEKGIKVGIWSPPSWAPQWLTLELSVSGWEQFSPVNLRNFSQATE